MPWSLVAAGVLLAGTCGGYLDAAQGEIVLGYLDAAQGEIVLGVLLLLVPIGVQAPNGVKNLLGLIVDLVAGLPAGAVAVINWTSCWSSTPAPFVACLLGSRFGRRLPSRALRSVVVGNGPGA